MKITPKLTGLAGLAVLTVTAIAIAMVITTTSHAQGNQKDITGLTADNSTSVQLAVSWDRVPNAADYRISWAQNGQPYPSLTDKSSNGYPEPAPPT